MIYISPCCFRLVGFVTLAFVAFFSFFRLLGGTETWDLPSASLEHFLRHPQLRVSFPSLHYFRCLSAGPTISSSPTDCFDHETTRTHFSPQEEFLIWVRTASTRGHLSLRPSLKSCSICVPRLVMWVAITLLLLPPRLLHLNQLTL